MLKKRFTTLREDEDPNRFDLGRYKKRSLFQEIRKTRKTRQEECQWRFLKLYIIEFTYNRITYNRISTKELCDNLVNFIFKLLSPDNERHELTNSIGLITKPVLSASTTGAVQSRGLGYYIPLPVFCGTPGDPSSGKQPIVIDYRRRIPMLYYGY
ncbi:hypothetical protein BpHYR1_002814 [Brachionus plicatilis]|uniref:Uncharacterized protein n=1 Tax=Brachionus plicatilis TaxID=10195 RepID=A0A3M7PQU2_BRAPC|nr:hypothetical protein BpHYR1_002814 [Brachionus plicatilis]